MSFHEEQNSSRRRGYFRIGKLWFGAHGLLGLSSLLSNLLYCFKAVPEHSLIFLLWMTNVLNLVTANHATTLFPQVPAKTQILPGIVAPHKEAFRRTVLSMNYLIVRVVLQQCTHFLSKNMSIFFLVLAWWPLFPKFYTNRLDWFNGNTWIFVFPISFGVTGDLWQYIVTDKDVIQSDQLMQVQLLGLCLAFGFTLAFRSYLPMRVVYSGAAIGVWRIIEEGIETMKTSS